MRNRTRANGSEAQPVTIERMSSARDLREFVRFPWKVYTGDPHWVPPLIRDAEKMLREHPFLEHGEAAYFGARQTSSGKLVARVAAIENRLHNEIHEERVGFFGFFDFLAERADGRASQERRNASPGGGKGTPVALTERDHAVMRALFAEVERWASERKLTHLRGPASFSSNEEWGLLVDGFDSSPRIMMTYNPPHYAGLLEECGFRKAKDIVAYYLDNPDPPERMVQAAERIAARKGVVVRAIDMRRFQEEVQKARQVYNRAWERNWGFVPMTEAEFAHMAKEMKPVVKPELVLFAEKEGEPVGFTMAIPDANVALKHANGRLFPFGILKLLWHARKIHVVRVPVLGLVPEYQGSGIDQLLYLRLFQGGHKHGFTAGEFSWILEDNLRMRQALDKMGARVYKTYRLYEKPLAEKRLAAGDA